VQDSNRLASLWACWSIHEKEARIAASLADKELHPVINITNNLCVWPILRVHPQKVNWECGWNYTVRLLGLANHIVSITFPVNFLGRTREIMISYIDIWMQLFCCLEVRHERGRCARGRAREPRTIIGDASISDRLRLHSIRTLI